MLQALSQKARASSKLRLPRLWLRKRDEQPAAVLGFSSLKIALPKGQFGPDTELGTVESLVMPGAGKEDGNMPCGSRQASLERRSLCPRQTPNHWRRLSYCISNPFLIRRFASHSTAPSELAALERRTNFAFFTTFLTRRRSTAILNVPKI